MTHGRRDWLCDVNVLVALVLTTHIHHRQAHAALADHQGTWATCPLTEAALFRLLLNPRVAGRSASAAEVTAILRSIHREPRWRWVADESSLADPLVDVSVLQGHQQVTDLHLVNLAARTERVLVTFDAALPSSLTPADRRHVLVLPQGFETAERR